MTKRARRRTDDDKGDNEKKWRKKNKADDKAAAGGTSVPVQNSWFLLDPSFAQQMADRWTSVAKMETAARQRLEEFGSLRQCRLCRQEAYVSRQQCMNTACDLHPLSTSASLPPWRRLTAGSAASSSSAPQ